MQIPPQIKTIAISIPLRLRFDFLYWALRVNIIIVKILNQNFLHIFDIGLPLMNLVPFYTPLINFASDTVQRKPINVKMLAIILDLIVHRRLIGIKCFLLRIYLHWDLYFLKLILLHSVFLDLRVFIRCAVKNSLG